MLLEQCSRNPRANGQGRAKWSMSNVYVVFKKLRKLHSRYAPDRDAKSGGFLNCAADGALPLRAVRLAGLSTSISCVCESEDAVRQEFDKSPAHGRKIKKRTGDSGCMPKSQVRSQEPTIKLSVSRRSIRFRPDPLLSGPWSGYERGGIVVRRPISGVRLRVVKRGEVSCAPISPRSEARRRIRAMLPVQAWRSM